ncbi:DUF4870 domain-containing protein [Agreia sp.]|uniref:DUF4870 domain-containing protein n=1 Tax=Agreia sp. TaxID=1872416 RepID=UPI0035BC42CA
MSDPNAAPQNNAGAGDPTPPPYTQPAGQVPPDFGTPAGASVPPQYGAPSAGQTPPPGYTPQPAATPGAPLSQSDDKLWASLAHFGGVLSFIPPLIIWLVFKDRGPLVNQEGKESLNYQITIAIAWVASFIVGAILAFIPFIGGILALIITLAIWAAQIIFPIIGGVKVNGGGTYRYPFAIRLIK